MLTMSDTPRTDAAVEWVRPVDQSDTGPPNEQYVDAEFARELERELADAHENNRIIQADNLDECPKCGCKAMNSVCVVCGQTFKQGAHSGGGRRAKVCSTKCRVRKHRVTKRGLFNANAKDQA